MHGYWLSTQNRVCGNKLKFLKKLKWQPCPHIFPNFPKIFHYLPIIATANVHKLIWSLIEIHEGTSVNGIWLIRYLTPSNYVLYNRLVTPINHSNHFCWCSVSEELDIWPPYWNRCSKWKRREARVLTLMSSHSCSPKGEISDNMYNYLAFCELHGKLEGFFSTAYYL